MPPFNPTPTCRSCGRALPRSEFDHYPSGPLRPNCRSCDAPLAEERDRLRNRPEWIVDPETGCWRWNLYVDRLGYGVASLGGSGRSGPAHRFIYERLVGPIPEGMDLDHVKERGCRYRDCVNPAHLEPVTHVENCRRGKQSVLTLDIARAIRADPRKHREIAADYGIKRVTVTAIKAGRNWRE